MAKKDDQKDQKQPWNGRGLTARQKRATKHVANSPAFAGITILTPTPVMRPSRDPRFRTI